MQGQKADSSAGYSIEIDTGGTFTDGYLTGPSGSVQVKTDTTPHNLGVGVVDCVRLGAEAMGVDIEKLLRATGSFRLSTTVGTNTLINRDGARVGLLLAESLGDLCGRFPANLPLERDLVRLVPEEGGLLRQAALKAVRALLERGARVVVVALSGTPELPRREWGLRELIAADYPRHYLGAVPVLPSSQVTLCQDPLVRIQTAVLNAYVHPVMSRFLYRLEEDLRRLGYRRPLLVANADGGTSRVSKTTAIRTLGSGPAAAVAATQRLARHLGLRHVVSIDVGGTSCDISIVVQGSAGYSVRPQVEGVEVALPTVELRSIGIGGGSVAKVIEGKVLIGPESVGSIPGPVAFGLGGTQTTLTDAACCLGLLNPAYFLGGRKRLDAGAALEAVREQVARPLGVGAAQASRMVLDAAAEEVSRHIRDVLTPNDASPDATVLFASGGAGGLLAQAVAVRAALADAYVFPVSPVFSAFGLAGMDCLHTYEAMLNGNDAPAAVGELVRSAERDMRAEGVDAAAISYRSEIEVLTQDGDLKLVEVGEIGKLRDALDGLRPEAQAQLLRLRATASARSAPMPSATTGQPPPSATRQVAWDGESRPVPVLDWDRLPEGLVIAGPAVLESAHTTVIVPPSVELRIGSLGEAVLKAGPPATASPAMPERQVRA